ncbi:MAG: PepSY domain-containing protein [Nitratireductor sp.]
MMRSICLAILLMLSAPAIADGDGDDHDRARAAHERGDILPLSSILAIVEKTWGGRVIEVDLGRDDGRFVYEIEIVTPAGRLLEAEIDAATGDLIESDYEDD